MLRYLIRQHLPMSQQPVISTLVVQSMHTVKADVHNNRIVNVADPKDPTDAVNKRYVDNAVKNINNNINRLDNKIDHVDRRFTCRYCRCDSDFFLTTSKWKQVKA